MPLAESRELRAILDGRASNQNAVCTKREDVMPKPRECRYCGKPMEPLSLESCCATTTAALTSAEKSASFRSCCLTTEKNGTRRAMGKPELESHVRVSQRHESQDRTCSSAHPRDGADLAQAWRREGYRPLRFTDKQREELHEALCVMEREIQGF